MKLFIYIISLFALIFCTDHVAYAQKKKEKKEASIPELTIVVFGPIKEDYLNKFGVNEDEKFLANLGKSKRYTRINFIHVAQNKEVTIDSKNPFQYIPLYGKDQCNLNMDKLFESTETKLSLPLDDQSTYVLRESGSTYDCKHADNYPNITRDELSSKLQSQLKNKKNSIILDLSTFDNNHYRNNLIKKEIAKTIVDENITLSCSNCEEKSIVTWYRNKEEFIKKSEINVKTGDEFCYSFKVEEKGCQLNSNEFCNITSWENFKFSMTLYPTSKSDIHPDYLIFSQTPNGYYAINCENHPECKNIEIQILDSNENIMIKIDTIDFKSLLQRNEIYKSNDFRNSRDYTQKEKNRIKRNFPDKILLTPDNLGGDFQDGEDIPKLKLRLIFYPIDRNKKIKIVTQKIILNKCPIIPDLELSE